LTKGMVRRQLSSDLELGSGKGGLAIFKVEVTSDTEVGGKEPRKKSGGTSSAERK